MAAAAPLAPAAPPARVPPAPVAAAACAPGASATFLAGYSTDEDAAAFFASAPGFAARGSWLGLLPEAERSDAARFPQALPAGVATAHVTVAVPQTLTLETAQAVVDAADRLLAQAASAGGAGAEPPALVISCATSRRAGAALALLHARARRLGPEETIAFAQAQGLSFASVQPLRNWVASAAAHWLGSAAAPCSAAAPDAHSLGGVVFRQLFDASSSTYTCVLHGPHRGPSDKPCDSPCPCLAPPFPRPPPAAPAALAALAAGTCSPARRAASASSSTRCLRRPSATRRSCASSASR